MATDLNLLGRGLVIVGLLTVLMGLLFLFGEKVPLIGKLPGDLSFSVGGVKVFAPLATCLLLSLILNLVFNFFQSHK